MIPSVPGSVHAKCPGGATGMQSARPGKRAQGTPICFTARIRCNPLH